MVKEKNRSGMNFLLSVSGFSLKENMMSSIIQGEL